MLLRLRLETLFGTGISLFFSQRVNRPPAGQRHHPPQRLTFLSGKILRLVPNFHEHFLKKVVRLGLVVNDPQNQRSHDPVIAIIKLRKRVRVTRLNAQHQIDIARRARFKVNRTGHRFFRGRHVRLNQERLADLDRPLTTFSSLSSAGHRRPTFSFFRLPISLDRCGTGQIRFALNSARGNPRQSQPKKSHENHHFISRNRLPRGNDLCSTRISVARRIDRAGNRRKSIGHSRGNASLPAG